MGELRKITLKKCIYVILILYSPNILAFEYIPGNKPDPFKPPYTQTQTAVQTSGGGGLLTVDLQGIELLGTSIGNYTAAIIKTPTAKTNFFVKVGDRVGNSGGYIIAIRKDHIVVRQPINSRDKSGNQRYTSQTRNFEDVTINIDNAKNNRSKNDDRPSELPKTPIVPGMDEFNNQATNNIQQAGFNPPVNTFNHNGTGQTEQAGQNMQGATNNNPNNQNLPRDYNATRITLP